MIFLPIAVLVVIVIVIVAAAVALCCATGSLSGGAAFTPPEKHSMCSFMLNVKNPTLDGEMKRYWDIFLKGNEPRFKEPHITAFHFRINSMDVMYKNFDTIKQVATDMFHKYVTNISIHITDKAKLLGRPIGNRFLSLDCELQKSALDSIQEFRIKTLEAFKDIFNAKTMTVESVGDGSYSVLYDGKALINLPDYSYDINKWVPHISILSLFDIRASNPELFTKFEMPEGKANVKQIMDVLEKYYYEHTQIKPKKFDVEPNDIKFNCLS